MVFHVNRAGYICDDAYFVDSHALGSGVERAESTEDRRRIESSDLTSKVESSGSGIR